MSTRTPPRLSSRELSLLNDLFQEVEPYHMVEIMLLPEDVAPEHMRYRVRAGHLKPAFGRTALEALIKELDIWDRHLPIEENSFPSPG